VDDGEGPFEDAGCESREEVAGAQKAPPVRFYSQMKRDKIFTKPTHPLGWMAGADPADEKFSSKECYDLKKRLETRESTRNRPRTAPSQRDDARRNWLNQIRSQQDQDFVELQQASRSVVDKNALALGRRVSEPMAFWPLKSCHLERDHISQRYSIEEKLNRTFRQHGWS
jgi:hypothetical protein